MVTDMAKILVIYTGGTWGMVNCDTYRLCAKPLDEVKRYIPLHIMQGISLREFQYKGRIIDSSDADFGFCNKVTALIYKNYQKYDGFIVIMGTDTMANIAGLFSYMFEGLDKPIIFTGAMVPISEFGTDGIVNFSNAINLIKQMIAGKIPKINEVVVCFADKFIRGNRAIKRSNYEKDSFISLGIEPLAIFLPNKGIVVQKKLLFKQSNKFQIHKLGSGINILCASLFPVLCSSSILSDNFDATILTHDPPISTNNLESVRAKISGYTNYPIFYHSKERVTVPSNWIRYNEVHAEKPQQLMSKVSFILSQTRNINKIKEMFCSNLRGEVEEQE